MGRVEVRVYRCAPGRKGSRGQRWRWTAHAGNGRKIATAGEAYVNRQDCIDAVRLVFGEATRVRQVEADRPDILLRGVWF